ncbi:hypothetical protein [Bradyrhizobium sp. BWC-3-1]|uniref:hypothetical protein n=1 Tax=Bradyrhizobium TaxID=374 RepID=UPI00397C3710
MNQTFEALPVRILVVEDDEPIREFVVEALRRPKAIWTLRGWAIYVLQQADAIHKCEEHAGRRTAPIRMRGARAGCRET